MTKIYIIVEHGGSYDDKWKVIHSAWPTLEQAHAEIENIKNKTKELLSKMEIVKALYEEYKKQHPAPILPKQKEYPRWQSGLDHRLITPEMRAERDHVKQLNKQTRDVYDTEMQEWSKSALSVINTKRVELGLKPQGTIFQAISTYQYDEETSFDGEEIEFHGSIE